MKLKAIKLDSLRDLLIEELRDLYRAFLSSLGYAHDRLFEWITVPTKTPPHAFG